MGEMENSSVVESDLILKVLNDEQSAKLIPVKIYLIVVMLIGIGGNLSVCFIYKSKLKERTTSFFLVYLAFLDLLSCTISIPFELADLVLPLDFRSVAACKLFRFSETWLQSLSGLILVCVAFERYRKICKPFKDIKKRVRICTIISVIASLVMALPALVIFGRKTVQTRYEEIRGTECSADDHLLNSPLITVYYVGLLLTFVFSLVCFLTFYILIGVFLVRRKKRCIGETLRKISHEQKCAPNQATPVCRQLALLKNSELHAANNSSTSSLFRKRPSNASSCVENMGRLKVKTGKMTRIFLAVTVSFVLSFVPFLVAHILKAKGWYFTDFTGNFELLLYNFCVRSTFINSAINPVLYSLLNKKFRDDFAVYILRRKKQLPSIS